MGERIRTTDWSGTALGPIETWPATLRIALGICLGSRLPMFVWWGSALLNFYNDAYAPILGKRHPDALGRPARDTWHEIWDVVGPQADTVMQHGEATWNERVMLTMERHGYAEETYFTWSYSPIRDESGAVCGLYCGCTEDTARVLAERERDRLASQHQLALDASRMGWWHYDPATRTARYDSRYREIFGVTGESRPNDELLARLHPDDLPAVLAAVEAALDPADPQPYSIEYRVRRDDGSIRWVEAHGLAAFAGEGRARRAVSFVGTVADVTARKVADEQVRTVLESITDAFFAVGKDWRFIYVNPQAETLLGRSPGDLLGQSLWEVYPGLIGSAFEQAYRRVAAERVAVSMTEYYPDHDRWYEVHVYPASQGISIYFRDVTDRKRAETERDWLAAVVRNSPDFIGIAGLDGYPVFANAQAFRMVGIPDDATLRATKVSEFFVPEERAFVADVVLPTVMRDGRWRGELTFRNLQTGAPVPVLYDVFRIDNAHTGKPTHLATITRDITEQQRIASRDRLLVALDNATRTIADANTIIAVSSRLLAQHFHAERCVFGDVDPDEEHLELRGGFAADPTTLVGRRILTDYGATFADTLRSGEPFVSDDIERDARLTSVRDNFRAVGVRATASVPIYRAGRFVALIALTGTSPRHWSADEIEVIRLVGSRCWESLQRAAVERSLRESLEAEQRARTDAEQASRMKDEFLATLSHELRTPLNAILGWSQIVRQNPGTADKLAKGLATIERNARVQARIIDDLLDMSGIISGKIRLDVQRLSLASIVGSAVETVRPAADAKEVALRIALGGEKALVSGDAGRLQQVMWNLLSNAVKFTPRGGAVDVSLARDDFEIAVTIKDSGEGIRPEFLPYVFDRFRQADGSSTRRHGGLGLGLSIVKQLVELHGGRVEAHSEGPGRGASFVVRLPASRERDLPVAERGRRRTDEARLAMHSAITTQQIAGVRVLVVDDEPDALALVRQILEDAGATVTTASSARDAVAHVEADRPDVLVSDIGMPDEDGFSLIARVRALGAGRGGGVPAVALTAYARAEDRARSVLAGFQMHLAKPVEPIELLSVVARLAGRADAN